MGLLRGQCSESRKGHLRCCCNQVWMKNGGRIPWNVTPICETSQILSDGKTHYERRSGQPCKGPIIPFGSLVEYHPRTAKDQESINLKRKSCLDCSSDTHCTRGESGRVTYWLQTLRSWRRWTLRKSTQKDSMRKRRYFPKKRRIYFSNRRWTNQTSWRRSIPENIHLDTASTNSSRKSHRFSWRIRRVSSTTSRLVSGHNFIRKLCNGSKKWRWLIQSMI